MRNTRTYLLAMVLGTLVLAGCSREGADWKSASTADTAEAYQQFVQQHPKSPNVAQAQTRIAQIADDRDWQAAAAADTRDAYGQYIAQHAEGKWAQEARIRIENFAQTATTGGAGGATAAANAAPAAPITATPPAVAAKPASSTPAASAAPPSAPTRIAKAHAPAGRARIGSRAERQHFVQLGAFRSKARAESEWKKLAAKYPAEFKSLKPQVVAGHSKSGEVYKLRVSVSSAGDAKGLCATLKKHSLVCVPVTG